MTKAPQPKNGAAAYTLVWDAWNRLAEVKSGAPVTAVYAYDGLTRRVSAQAPSGTTGSQDYYYSDQWKVLQVTPSQVITGLKQFVWRGCDEDKLILRDQGGTSTTARLYAMDDGKNVTAVCGATGTVQERYSYSGFGATVFMTASFGARTASSYTWETLFCGYRYDSNTGLYQVRYRYLHAELGRWLSRDWVEIDPSSNLYAYIFNIPALITDPYGLDPVHDACEKDLQDAQRSDACAVSLIQLIQKMNCAPPQSQCICCNKNRSLSGFALGHYHCDSNTLEICEDVPQNEQKSDVIYALRHELTHAINCCRKLGNSCASVVCDEIQAYVNSGEYYSTSPQQQQRGVRNAVLQDVSNNPACRNTEMYMLVQLIVDNYQRCSQLLSPACGR